MNIDDVLATVPAASESAVSTMRARCRHRWGRYEGPEADHAGICLRCGAHMDLTLTRRGRSSARLGKDQERRIERVYGPLKVGEFGDAIDLRGRDFAWQSKATRSPMPSWLALVDGPTSHAPSTMIAAAATAMLPILAGRAPLVIQSFIGQRTTIDRIWVRCRDWQPLHGVEHDASECGVWYVMSGIWFLTEHGRDAA